MIKSILNVFAIVSFFLLTVLSCHPKYPDYFSHIADSKVKSVLKKSIQFSGGMKAWTSIKTINYNKDFSLLYSNGEIEKKYAQRHEYSYDPINIIINSTENDNLVVTRFDGKEYQRYRNDTLLKTNTDLLRKAINTSVYVIGMPFKLTDRGVELSYLGLDTLPNGLVAHVIQAIYAPESFPNHSTPDTWKYYFDLDDFRVVANSVKTLDHDALILNETFERVEGILLNKNRKSFRLKENGKIDYLRASYKYYDYNLKFK